MASKQRTALAEESTGCTTSFLFSFLLRYVNTTFMASHANYMF